MDLLGLLKTPDWCPGPDSNRHTFRRRILNPQNVAFIGVDAHPFDGVVTINPLILRCSQ